MTLRLEWTSGWNTPIGHNPSWRSIQRAIKERDRLKAAHILIARKDKPWVWIQVYKKGVK